MVCSDRSNYSVNWKAEGKRQIAKYVFYICVHENTDTERKKNIPFSNNTGLKTCECFVPIPLFV